MTVEELIQKCLRELGQSPEDLPEADRSDMMTYEIPRLENRAIGFAHPITQDFNLVADGKKRFRLPAEVSIVQQLKVAGWDVTGYRVSPTEINTQET